MVTTKSTNSLHIFILSLWQSTKNIRKVEREFIYSLQKFYSKPMDNRSRGYFKSTNNYQKVY